MRTTLLVLACLTTPILAGLLVPSRSPVPFVATLIVHLLMLVHVALLGRRWFRPKRRAQPADCGSAVVPLIAGVATLLLVLFVADEYGIRGSALPRLQQGFPMPADLGYLGAVAVILLTIAGTLGLMVLLARTHLPPDMLGRAARFVQASVSAPARPRSDESPPSYATKASDGFWKRLISPSGWVVFAICTVPSVTGLTMMVVGDSELALIGTLAVMLAPVPVTAWTVLQSLWRVDMEMGIVRAALWRNTIVPFVTAVPLALVNILIALVPPVRQRFEQQWPTDTWDGLLPTEQPSLLSLAGMSALMGCTAALLAGIALSVAIVLPVTAFWKPEQFIKDNMMSTSEKHRAANTAVVRVSTILILLIFVIVSLLVLADQGSIWWWIGILLIPLGVALTYFVWSRQRVDHKKRSEWDVSGVHNPDDPPPDSLR